MNDPINLVDDLINLIDVVPPVFREWFQNAAVPTVFKKKGEKHCRTTDKRVTNIFPELTLRCRRRRRTVPFLLWGLLLVHVYPDSAGVSGIRAGIDPLDAVDTVVDIGIDEVLQGLFVAALLGVLASMAIANLL